MVKIKSKLKWDSAIKQFGSKPKSASDWEKVTELYRKLGGKITVMKSEKLYEAFNLNMKEGFSDSLQKFLSKWITNPIVLGIALYFLSKQMKKYISK